LRFQWLWFIFIGMEYPTVDRVIAGTPDRFIEAFQKTFDDPAFLDTFTGMFPAHSKWAQEGGLKETFAEFIRAFETNAQIEGDKLLVFRCMSIEKPKEFLRTLAEKPVGIFWSWTMDGAACYHGSRDNPWVWLHGLIELQAINLKETLALNCQMFGGEETEIRLLAGSPLTVVEVETVTDEKHQHQKLKRHIQTKASGGE
jgi:hypothetical protein